MPKLIQKLLHSGTFQVFIAKTAFKVFVLGLVLILARNLSTRDFSDFQYLSGIINILSSPTVALAMIVTRTGFSFPAHSRPENLRWLMQKGWGGVTALPLLVGLCLLIFDDVLAQALHIQSPFAITLAGLLVVATVLFNYFLGYLQVLERFGWIAIAFLSMGFLNPVLGVLVIPFFSSVDVAIAIQVVATVVTMLIVIQQVVRRLHLPAQKPEISFRFKDLKFAIKMALGTTLVFALLYMDTLVVKQLYGIEQSNLYLQIEFVSRIFFVLASSISVVLFTSTSKIFSEGNNPLSKLLKSSSIFVVFSVAVLAFIIPLKDYIVAFIFPGKALTDIDFIVILLIGRVLQSYIFILFNYTGSWIDRRTIVCLVGALVTEALLIWFFHATLEDLAMNVIYASTAGIGLFFLLSVFGHERHQKPA